MRENSMFFCPQVSPSYSMGAVALQFITVVYAASPAGGGDGRQRSRSTGWRVGRQSTPHAGMRQSAAPTFSPKVKKWVCVPSRSRRPGSPAVKDNPAWHCICVNMGSLSISTRTGRSASWSALRSG